jgi:hypothetical protein
MKPTPKREPYEREWSYYPRNLSYPSNAGINETEEILSQLIFVLSFGV